MAHREARRTQIWHTNLKRDAHKSDLRILNPVHLADTSTMHGCTIYMLCIRDYYVKVGDHTFKKFQPPSKFLDLLTV